MPKRVEDRESKLELAKSLFVQGVKTEVIAKETGVNGKTLRTWSKRYHWRELVSKTTNVLAQAGERTLSSELATQSATLRQQIAQELIHAGELLAAESPKGGLKALAERLEVIGKLVSSSSKVFQWHQEAPRHPINVHVLNQIGATISSPCNPPGPEALQLGQ